MFPFHELFAAQSRCLVNALKITCVVSACQVLIKVHAHAWVSAQKNHLKFFYTLLTGLELKLKILWNDINVVNVYIADDIPCN